MILTNFSSLPNIMHWQFSTCTCDTISIFSYILSSNYLYTNKLQKLNDKLQKNGWQNTKKQHTKYKNINYNIQIYKKQNTNNKIQKTKLQNTKNKYTKYNIHMYLYHLIKIIEWDKIIGTFENTSFWSICGYFNSFSDDFIPKWGKKFLDFELSN